MHDHTLSSNHSGLDRHTFLLSSSIGAYHTFRCPGWRGEPTRLLFSLILSILLLQIQSIKSYIFMKQIVTITILLLNLFLVSCSSNTTATQEDSPGFSVELQNLGDGVAFQHRDDGTIIDIVSPSGIGSAKFTLRSGEMPRQINIWLHLEGLEAFRLISEQVTLAASIPTSGGLNDQSQMKITGDSEGPISPFDPLKLKLDIVSSSQEIPLQDGYFEIVVPGRFLQQSGNSFEIQWIDFFR